MLVFSTHAFTEGDVLSSFFGWLYAISTHAFTEGDGVQLKRKFYWKRISTHAFTEGDISAPRVLEYECISTHAFTEGDISSIPANSSSSSFQLTPSRKATFFWRLEFWHVIISTHAFTEGDRISIRREITQKIISTHAFTEGDPIVAVEPFLTIRFQLTPSRKATKAFTADVVDLAISTHAFTEGDSTRNGCGRLLIYFNSRLHGRRRL